MTKMDPLDKIKYKNGDTAILTEKEIVIYKKDEKGFWDIKTLKMSKKMIKIEWERLKEEADNG